MRKLAREEAELREDLEIDLQDPVHALAEAAMAERLARLRKLRDNPEDETVKKKEYDVFDLYKKVGPAQCIAKSGLFNNLTLLVITANGVWIGWDTDHNHAATIDEAKLYFQIAESFFCIYFTAEVVIRFFAFKKILRTSKWPRRRTLCHCPRR